MIPGFAANAIDVIADTPLTINRPGAPVEVLGELSPGPVTQTQIVASVQPARGHDLQRLPEGRRSRLAVVVISKGEIQLEDTFDWGGDTFEVDHVQPWGGAFYDAIATKEER